VKEVGKLIINYLTAKQMTFVVFVSQRLLSDTEISENIA
jgi:hypothetical protein